jgi:UTP:GlnB (protein PII) uridylyltransferase
MLPTDPKEAAKLGKAWGEVLAETIFGVADVLKNGKNMKAAANAKRLQENAEIAAKNAVTRAKNEAYMKKKQEETFMKMSHSEREAYKKILKEQQAAASVKKVKNEDDDDTAIIVILILFSIILIFGFVAYEFDFFHR